MSLYTAPIYSTMCISAALYRYSLSHGPAKIIKTMGANVPLVLLRRRRTLANRGDGPLKVDGKVGQ